MAPSAGRGLLEHKHFDRQMGCMAGFLHLFDRHQILARKRLPPPPMVMGSFASPSEISEASSGSMKDGLRSPSPDFHSPPPRTHRLPLVEVIDSSRSSLQSRDHTRCLSLGGEGRHRPRGACSAAVAVSPGEQSDASEAADEIDRKCRSPSVVARLMGLDDLPDSAVDDGGCESGRPELRRSASESRVPRHATSYRFLDGDVYPKRSPAEADRVSVEEWIRMANLGDIRVPEALKPKFQAKTSRLPPLQRKSSFDADEFFPEPKRRGLLPIELEKRHLIRGMDEASRDLETLKQILEALQLKGLLHSTPSDHQISGRRDRYSRLSNCSPIVVIEPVPSPPRPPSTEPRPQMASKSIAGRRNNVEEAAIPSLRQSRRVENATKERVPRPSAKRRISSATDSAKTLPPRPRISAANPPKTPPHRVATVPTSGRPLSNRRQKLEVAPKERINSPAQGDTNAAAAPPTMDVEKSWAEDYWAGRQLLKRCDQLLSSIAEFTAAAQVAVAVDSVANAAAEQQPSPVSVLEVASPPRSPLTKRAIDFEGNQLPGCEEEMVASNDGDDPAAQEEGQQEEEGEEDVESNDDDYACVAQILRSSDSPGGATDVYTQLEKRRSAFKSIPLHRRLLFDAVAEILDRKRYASHPPWETFVRPGSLSDASQSADAGPMLPVVWSELLRAREPVFADDVNVVTCMAARRDLEREDHDAWARLAAEVAEAAIQIERRIFKDLVDGTIRDLVDACPPQEPKPSKSNGRRGPIKVNKRHRWIAAPGPV